MAEAPFQYSGLDRLFHERARLGIATALAAHPEGLPFTALRDLVGLTDGNLNRHLKVLVDEGCAVVEKDRRQGRARTRVVLTAAGRARFQAYLEALEAALREAVAAAAADPSSAPA